MITTLMSDDGLLLFRALPATAILRSRVKEMTVGMNARRFSINHTHRPKVESVFCVSFSFRFLFEQLNDEKKEKGKRPASDYAIRVRKKKKRSKRESRNDWLQPVAMSESVIL